MELSEYKRALREYTVVGVSTIFKRIVSKEFSKFFGGGRLSSLLLVVRDGKFYHFQKEEEVIALVKSFLNRVLREDVDLDILYRDFDRDVSKLEEIYARSSDSYSLETPKEFYNLYESFIEIAYAASYGADFLDEIAFDEVKRKEVLDWIVRSRMRAENIYKHGEVVFIPQYTQWLAERVSGGYSSEQLQYLVDDELFSYCASPETYQLPEKNILNERKELFYGCFSNGTVEYAVGSEASKHIESLGLFSDEEAELSHLNELHGVVAFPGIVQGGVRRIFKVADTTDFKEGEIIVASMTDPNYIHIMKKASAFITDEGGILCHAAIVAREMKKPCIIGTKIATQVLKDGDLVEVDAERGIVTILERGPEQD